MRLYELLFRSITIYVTKKKKRKCAATLNEKTKHYCWGTIDMFCKYYEPIIVKVSSFRICLDDLF